MCLYIGLRLSLSSLTAPSAASLLWSCFYCDRVAELEQEVIGVTMACVHTPYQCENLMGMRVCLRKLMSSSFLLI